MLFDFKYFLKADVLYISLKIKIQVNLFFFFFYKEMKCLLCSFESKDQKNVLDHSLSYHNIDPRNCFFQKLFQSGQ